MRRLREVGAAVTTRRRWSRFALRAVALLAVALMLTVTVVLAPAASVPLVAESETKDCTLLAVHEMALPPGLLSV